MNDSATHRLTLFYVWLCILLPMLMAVLAALPPLLEAGGRPHAALALRWGFHSLCHHQPGRCFHLAGAPMALCARCLGLLLGTVLGSLLALCSPVRIGWRQFLPPVAAWAVLGIDVFGGVLGWWQTGNVVRMVTGVLAAASSLYLLTSLLLNSDDLAAGYAATCDASSS